VLSSVIRQLQGVYPTVKVRGSRDGASSGITISDSGLAKIMGEAYPGSENDAFAAISTTHAGGEVMAFQQFGFGNQLDVAGQNVSDYAPPPGVERIADEFGVLLGFEVDHTVKDSRYISSIVGRVETSAEYHTLLANLLMYEAFGRNVVPHRLRD